MTHSDLKATEHYLAAVVKERTTSKTELMATEKNVLANTSAARMCSKEIEVYKTRAQTAEAWL
jgi:hypothetical protein